MKNINGNQCKVGVWQNRGRSFLAKGWIHFLRANELKVGDKCIFQPLSNRTMQVHIIKNQNEKSKDQLLKVHTKQKILRLVTKDTMKKSWTSCSDTVKVAKPKISSNKDQGLMYKLVKTEEDPKVLEWIIQPSELHTKYTDHPEESSSSAGPNEVNDITMKDSDGNQWPIHSMTGWEQFVKSNNMEAGDKCIFGPISDLTMQIEVKKTSEYEWQASSTGQRISHDMSEGITKKIQRDEGVIGKVVKSKREYAALDRITLPYRSPRSYMGLPKSFSYFVGLDKRDDITVKDWDGRQWPVRISHYSNSRCYLTTGWGQFVKDNYLKAGDKCIFGPVAGRTMQVQIVKRGNDQN